jgi:hypothetical protein
MKYFFGFRLISPTGNWTVAGPYDSYEEAKITYYQAHAADRELSPPFPAQTKDKAEEILARQRWPQQAYASSAATQGHMTGTGHDVTSQISAKPSDG